MLSRIKSQIKSFISMEVCRQLEGLPCEKSCPKPSTSIAQKLLMLEYKKVDEQQPQLSFSEVGFSEYSQTDEDGILLYIFAVAGIKTAKCIEICAGDGTECNTANLIINHGWHGLLVDGNESFVMKGREFFGEHGNTYVYPPKFVHSWITSENVNQVIESAGFSGSVDLLSLDMDGVDYWILESISVIKPRVIVLEYQDILGPERSCTVPYSDSFDKNEYPQTAGMPNYCGASLMAFKRLLEPRGYRLVGTNRLQYNAFFVHESITTDRLPSKAVSECFTHDKVVWGMKERFETVKHFPWVDV